MSKYELELKKWQGEIDCFQELNIELNLSPEQYKQILKLKPELIQHQIELESLVKDLLAIKKEFKRRSETITVFRKSCLRSSMFLFYPERVKRMYQLFDQASHGLIFKLFGIKPILRNDQGAIVNVEDVEEGLSEGELEPDQSQFSSTKSMERQSDYSFFNNLVDKALEA